MKYIIVTGDRYATWPKWGQTIRRVLEDHTNLDRFTLVHGAASGVDIIAGQIAADFGSRPNVVPFRADWKRYGKAAGPRRNADMLAYVQGQRRDGDTAEVIAFHDSLGASKGTKDMVRQARRAGLPVTVYGSDGRVR